MSDGVSTILVTGATGLIGRALVEDYVSAGFRVVATARHAPAKGFPGDVKFIPGDVRDLPPFDDPVDWIVHAAAPTSGRFFVEHPEETESIIVDGTRAMLELAVRKKAKGFVFLSSMEVYGAPADDRVLDEGASFIGDLSAPRSSYARGKRAAEALCGEYARKGLRAMSVRLAQTFGKGVAPTEGRVFAQFLRAARAGRPISLSTAGTSTRMYLETEDAVAAIRAVLEKGEAGGIYNAANPETYCSLAELANRVDRLFGGVGVRLGRDDDPVNACYPPPHHLRLDVSRLLSLGWRPRFGLDEMFRRLAAAVPPAVSIIMPVYNAGSYLREAIESVLAQTFRDFELLLIDDAATDGSGAVCDEYAAKDPRVQVRHGRNGGICASRNVGLDLATGEWVAFCDHDDFMEADALEVAIQAVSGNGLDLVKFNHQTYHRFSNSRVFMEFLGVRRPTCRWRAKSLLSVQDYPFFKALAGLVWDGLYRRSSLEEHGLRFDESFKTGGEDFDFMTRLLAVVGEGMWIDRILYRHYFNVGRSTSANCHLNLLEDFLRVAQTERRLFDFSDSGLRFVSFAEWSVFAIHFVFFVNDCPLGMREKRDWLVRYAEELVGEDAQIPLRELPLKRRFLYICLRMHMLGGYLLFKTVVVRLRRALRYARR